MKPLFIQFKSLACLSVLLLWSGSVFGQKGIQFGGNVHAAFAFQQEETAPPAGVEKSLFWRPNLAFQLRWQLSGPLYAETGMWLQSHGTRMHYTVDFGSQAGKRNFLVSNSRSGILAIPIWLAYSPNNKEGRKRWTVSAGASCLLNPFLSARAVIDGTYSGGTADTLYTRSVGTISTFTNFAVSAKVEYCFWERNGKSLAISLAAQRGFSAIRNSSFAYSLNAPTYENVYLRSNRGDLLAAGLSFWFFPKAPSRLSSF